MTSDPAAEEHDVPPPARVRVDDALGGADPAGGTPPGAGAAPDTEATGERIIFTGPAEEHDVPPPARVRVDDALGGADPAQAAALRPPLVIWAFGGLTALLAATAVLHGPRRR